MDKNSKTVWLTALSAATAVIVAASIYLHLQDTVSIVCSDGTSHPRLNSSQFATKYAGHTMTLEGTLENKGKIAAEVGTVKLQEMSDAIQTERLRMQALAAGYDTCAVSAKEFDQSLQVFQQMDSIAEQIETLSARQNGSPSDTNSIQRLVDEYIRLSRNSSSREVPPIEKARGH